MSRDLYEKRDVNTWRLGWVITGLVATLIACCLISAWYFWLLAGRTARQDGPFLNPVATRMELFPAPRLQSMPARDLAAVRAREEAVLESYRWVNRETGIVGIPIDAAMARLVEQGVPVGKDAPGPRETWREALQRRAREGAPPNPRKGEL